MGLGMAVFHSLSLSLACFCLHSERERLGERVGEKGREKGRERQREREREGERKGERDRHKGRERERELVRVSLCIAFGASPVPTRLGVYNGPERATSSRSKKFQ